MKGVKLFSLWLIFSVPLFLYSLLNLNKVHQTFLKETSLKPVNYLNLRETNLSNDLSENSSPDQDIRIQALKSFFKDIKSPLVDYAQEIVRQADIYGLDYALLPAISMQESGGCQRIPEDSHNCWGYGIYGNKVRKFNSYEEAIAQVSKTIKEAYIKKGRTNATLLEDLWTPSSKGQWSYSVNYYIGKIKDIERNFSSS